MSQVNILLKFDFDFALCVNMIGLRIYLSRHRTEAGEEFPLEGGADNKGHVQTFGEMPAVENGNDNLPVEEILRCK